MNIAAIQTELGRRLAPVAEHVYINPPASPSYPCAIVHFPFIETFHLDLAHGVTRTSWEVSLAAGRGDVDESYSVIAEWLSDGTPTSVRDALEAKRTEATPWLRLALASSTPPQIGADSAEVTLTIQIDS